MPSIQDATERYGGTWSTSADGSIYRDLGNAEPPQTAGGTSSGGGQGGSGGVTGVGAVGAGGAGGGSAGAAGAVGEAGAGLLDPGSEYYQRLMEGMKGRIGKEAAGQQRSAALRAAQGGFGGGQSGELMDVQGNIGRAGLEAQGEAGANLRLEAPKLGANMALGAGGLALGGEQLAEGGRQFDVGSAEGARKFDQSQSQQQGQYDTSMGQQQIEYGGSQGNIAAALQQQADQFAASQSQEDDQLQQQIDFAMEQLYGGSQEIPISSRSPRSIIG